MEAAHSREGSAGRVVGRAAEPSGPARARANACTLGRRCALVLALAACLLAAGSASAPAVIVHLANGRTLSYQPLRGARTIAPFDQFFSNLDYNGGPVMASNTNYAFYWDPSGGAAYPSDYQPGINQYLTDLAHDSGGRQNVDSVSTQYNDATGAFANYESEFGGAIVDTDPYPANGCTRATICLTDEQIRTELAHYVIAHGLPHDLAHEYFLLTPPGVQSCFEAAGRECSAGSTAPAYCAYHGNGQIGETELIYADDPYVTGNPGCDDGNHPNGSSSDGALEGGLSHEHNESITDPEPNNAWTDIGGSGGEIGDKCSEDLGSPLGSAPNGASYNQVINEHLYWYQEEWSNQSNQCLQRLTFNGAEPTAMFTSQAGAGNEISFDASGSTAPGGVARYNWQFNDGPGLSTPVESTAPTVSHTFAKAGIYLVALTVFAADGTSIGTGSAVVVGQPPAPSVRGVTPGVGPAAGGTSVKITGTALAGATAVSFGGSAASSYTVSSASSITAVSPPSTAATVADVTVRTPSGTSAKSSRDHFKFGPPTVTEVSPEAGPRGGGTSIAVSGSGFALGAGATAFKFGTTTTAAESCSTSSACIVVTPAHKAVIVQVRAMVGKLVSPNNPPDDRFTYR
jgi:PKD domain/IPT/TIG domain